MFEDFFENNALTDEVKPNAAHTQQIKAAVMAELDSCHQSRLAQRLQEMRTR